MSRFCSLHRLIGVGTLAASLHLTPLTAETFHWQQPQYIIDSFISIALQREHGPANAELNKWQSPILFYIDDRTADEPLHARMVEQHLQHLASITGLQITAAASPEQANLNIIFSTETRLDKELQTDLSINNKAFRQEISASSVCLGRIAVDAEGRINKARVLIPVDRARAHAKLMACVVEELTQVLGLANDSTRVYPSIFNDRSFNDFLTGLDYLLLKLLYHPALSAGMKNSEVSQRVSEIVATEAFQSQIGDAHQTVRDGSLENWLN